MSSFTFRHREYGEPTAIYRYTDVHVICRYLHEGKKQILPWTMNGDGKWHSKSAEKPRPLYNAQALTTDSKVVLVEGEKCVEHLKALGISRVPICWPGGAQAAKHADWSALYGRDVLLFPDHDEPGHKCMLWIANELLGHGCTVSIVAHIADELPEGWDVADTTWSKPELNEWLKGRIRPVQPAPSEDVPRETSARGKPRSRPDGGAPNGHVVDGNTGSVFVSWERLGLETNSNGMPHPHLANAQRILANHPALVGKIWYDEFHEKVFQTVFQEEPAEWADTHDTRMTIWIQSNLRLAKIGHQIVQRAVDDYARLNVRNEVHEWMEALQWDDCERLPQAFHRIFGAEDTPYHSQVGRCWFVSMVARTYQPGCKVDTMPVFEGAQGLMKSSALRAIGGKWYTEMHEDITSKDFLQGLSGNLLIEIPELHAFGKADIRRIKGIISCPTDRYRASYGRHAANHPRRGVWAGTTNENDYLRDDTGARRFWPVKCGRINLDFLLRNREQLFAEAVVRFKRDEPWWDIDPTLAREEQEERLDYDEWTDPVLSYCRNLLRFSIGEILRDVFSMPLKEQERSAQMRIASILKRAGYAQKQTWVDGRNLKIWYKK